MALPELDPEQRRAAAQRATEARQRRAEVKNRLRRGDLDLAGLLAVAVDDEAVAKMRVIDALEALPAIGPVKAARLMESNRIATSRRLRGLGVRQRAGLVAALERRA